MRKLLIAFALAFGASAAPAIAATDLHVSVGINVPAYPTLVRVPNYPVYYAPSVRANYFFFDGLYWVFNGRDWFASPWYNGPWELVDRYEVPLPLLRVPVRYYRAPPPEFRVYRVDYAPVWDRSWGTTWAERSAGWRERSLASYALAPLPVYQRQYAGTRYPSLNEQIALQTRNYAYQPHDQVTRQRFAELRSKAGKDEGRGPPAHAKAWGYRAKQEGLATPLDADRPGPPAHAKAYGYRAKQQAEADRMAARDADDHHPGRGHAKGHDKEHHGKGHDR